ncbi:LisH domain-containing protein armc9, partial [Chytriomyces hyalinus]
RASRKETESAPALRMFVIAFRDGDRNEFFHLWDEHCPHDVVKSNLLYQKLEFQASIFFAVFRFHPYVSKSSGQFLSFNALPYITNARQHPTFNEIFTERRVSELESKLIAFLGSALKSAHVPKILRILAGVDMRPVEVAAGSLTNATIQYLCSALDMLVDSLART